eukprot:jgi/Tetstr1/429133/TSEL_019095.t1
MPPPLLGWQLRSHVAGVDVGAVAVDGVAAKRSAWDYYNNVDNRAPGAEVRMPSTTLMELKFISKTRLRATYARVELASSQTA